MEAARAGDHWRDAGLSLVEVLLAVAVLGIGVTAVMGGMMTSIKVAGQGQTAAVGQSAINDYAEAVSTTAYANCATSYAAPGFTPPSGWTVGTQVVSYWNGTSFVGTCGADPGLQKVRLVLTATDGTTASVSLAKRKP